MFRSLTAATFVLALSPALHSQETVNNASLGGRVTDASGAVVRSATVTARQIATNRTRTYTTDSEGRFRFPYSK